jgi:hypothetical protein
MILNRPPAVRTSGNLVLDDVRPLVHQRGLIKYRRRPLAIDDDI